MSSGIDSKGNITGVATSGFYHTDSHGKNIFSEDAKCWFSFVKQSHVGFFRDYKANPYNVIAFNKTTWFGSKEFTTTPILSPEELLSAVNMYPKEWDAFTKVADREAIISYCQRIEKVQFNTGILTDELFSPQSKEGKEQQEQIVKSSSNEELFISVISELRAEIASLKQQVSLTQNKKKRKKKIKATEGEEGGNDEK